jgi:hypothetical protein
VNGILAVPPVVLAPRVRMARYLDKLAYALLLSDGCRACRDCLADRCGECAADDADLKTVTAAIGAVYAAATDAEALAVYDACLLGLAGAEVTR